MTNLKNIALGFGLLLSSLSFGQGPDCASMQPACTDALISFPAQTDVTAASIAEPTNDYGCLGSSPNPAWYFFEIGVDGPIDMSLSAGLDIDFIIYGPFNAAGPLTALEVAQGACGTMGSVTAPIVDCSYSGTNMETPSIPNALINEVYVMLVTNFSNQPQAIEISQTGGAGATDCSIVTACVSQPGTFTVKKNGIATALDLYLCADDFFSITNDVDANGDPNYILPNDTIFAPIGDYDVNASDPTTAQIMWLVYTQDPTVTLPGGGTQTNQDPINTTGFMGIPAIIPTEDLGGNLLSTTALMNLLGGCGTYWFAPVAGDDGVGGNNNMTNNINDNGGVEWDKDGNGCYFIGEAHKVTFACPIVAVPTIACGPTNGNAMDITITGGVGNYTITNQGVGNILNTPIPNAPGIATVTDLVNNSAWSIAITDNSGCEGSANGIFDAPTITALSQTPASTCPGTSLGSALTEIGNSGLAPLTVLMNGNVIAPSVYTITATAGTLVSTIVTDANGCTVEGSITVLSQDHYIEIDPVLQSTTDELCLGDATGTATVNAIGVDASGNPDNTTITNIVWTNPDGIIVPISPGNPSGQPNVMLTLVQTGMMSGTWTLDLTDDTGCSTTVAIVIGSPQEINLSISNSTNITCFGQNSGDITLDVNGGVAPTTYSWSPNNPIQPGSPNASTANQLIIGDYKMYVTDVNGCVDSIEITLTQQDEIDIDIDLAKLHVACYGAETGSIVITDVYNAYAPFSYAWDLQPFYTNPPVTSYFADGLGIGTYSVTIQDDEGCSKNFQYTITQNDSLFWDELTVTSAVCRDLIPFDNGSGQISAAVARTLPGIGGSNMAYQWTEDATGNQPPNNNQTTWGNLNPGFYTMVAIDDHGCVLDTTIYLDSLSPSSIFEATSPQFTSNYVGTAPVEVTFTNNSTNYSFANQPLPYGVDPTVDTSMIWTFMLNDDPYVTEEISPLTRIYDAEGLYTVCLKVTENLNGCVDSSCIDIQIYDVPSLTVPNVFTPNNDGQNDEFFFPNKVITEFECTVFDRWGAEVFKFTSIDDAWDGTKFNEGNNCSDGVYFYRYTGESSNGTQYKGQGDLQLIRN